MRIGNDDMGRDVVGVMPRLILGWMCFSLFISHGLGFRQLCFLS